MVQIFLENSLVQLGKKHEYQVQQLESNIKTAVENVHREVEKNREDFVRKLDNDRTAREKAEAAMAKVRKSRKRYFYLYLVTF